MLPFLQRFLTAVDRNLGDPVQSKRFTAADKLDDLRRVEVQVWENLLAASGQESTIGRAESDITLQDDVSFYQLPGNFRQFLGFQRRQDGDRSKVIGSYESISMYDSGPGVEIMDAQRGMMVRPCPSLGADEDDWVLTYMKGPVPLHYAEATGMSVDGLTLTTGPPGTNAGEVIHLMDYYNNCLVRVYSATDGYPQTREITSCVLGGVANAYLELGLRAAFSPVPSGTTMYEIMPALPEPYDAIYALDVAIDKCSSLGMTDTQAALVGRRRPLWSACKNYFASNVADRMPRRSARLRDDEVDPYSG